MWASLDHRPYIDRHVSVQPLLAEHGKQYGPAEHLVVNFGNEDAKEGGDLFVRV